MTDIVARTDARKRDRPLERGARVDRTLGDRPAPSLIGSWIFALVPPIWLALATFPHVDPATAVDWQTYVAGTEAMLAGRSPYAPFQIAGEYPLGYACCGNGFMYPPSAIVLAPLLQPIQLWAALGATLYLGGLMAVLRHHDALRPGLAALVVWAAVFIPGFRDAWAGATVSPHLAGLLGLIYAGVPAAGLAAAIKVFPMPWAILTGRRGLPLTLVGLAVPALLSVALVGISPWLDYPRVVLNAEPECRAELASLTCRGLPTLVTWALGAWLVGLALIAPRAWRLLALGAVPIVMAPDLWWHYVLLLAPGVVAVTTVPEGPRGLTV